LGRLGAILRRAETEGLPWKNGGRTLYRRVVTGGVELLLYTGCRLSEVLNLRWEDIDFAAGLIKLADTKSGDPQRVMLNPPARQVLKALESQKGGSEWVLPSVTNPRQPISKDGIEAAWRKIRIAAQIDDVRMHDLRHTVGTYAGQTGANAFLVRDLLRHKNLAMTGRYVNRADSPVRTLSDQVGERIAAAMAGLPTAEVVPLRTATP
jgi:integrase